MKKILYILFGLALFYGCSRAEIPTYEGKDYIQFLDYNFSDREEIFSFAYSGSTVEVDTFYYNIRIVGPTKKYDRQVNLEQVPEYVFQYTYDYQGVRIDSVLVEKDGQAIPKIHYIPFTDPDVQNLMVVKADSATARIGIVLLRDLSLKEMNVDLSFQLVENNFFLQGDTRSLKSKLAITDKLTRPYYWNGDNGKPNANPNSSRVWGTYGPVKHQFMIDNSPNGEKWDEEFMTELKNDEGLMYWYVRIFVKYLTIHNEQRALEGLPPLREDPNNPATEVKFV